MQRVALAFVLCLGLSHLAPAQDAEAPPAELADAAVEKATEEAFKKEAEEAAADITENGKTLKACVVLSMRTIGTFYSPALWRALGRMADGHMGQEEAKTHELWRMVGICTQDFDAATVSDLLYYKKLLPTNFTYAGKLDAAEAKVLAIPEADWKELQVIATEERDDLRKQATTEASRRAAENPHHMAPWKTVVAGSFVVIWLVLYFVAMSNPALLKRLIGQKLGKDLDL